MKKNLLLLVSTLILLFIIAEMILRFFPVPTEYNFLAVNDNNSTFRATPNRDVVCSRYWNFRMPNKKHVNNLGFVNKHDYFTEGKRPLIAVVGDSYVEAAQVNDDQPFYQLLATNFPAGRVYSFGFSNAALSQYLAWSKFAQDTFHNNYLIINVVGNDFDESLKKYRPQKGFYYYEEQPDKTLKLIRYDYTPKEGLYFFMRRSALLRYISNSLEGYYVYFKIKTKLFSSNKTTYVGNKPAEVDMERERDSYRAIDAFLRDLPDYSGLQPDRVLIMVDGLRPALYRTRNEIEAAESSYVGKMNRYLLEQAKEKGYSILDLNLVFAEHYKKQHQRFEFPFDGHWNALGHEVVAQAIEATDFWKERVLNTSINN